jgi:hypothetical protein
MIPAILATPVVEGAVSSVLGGISSLFSSPTPIPGTSFNPYLNSASATAAPQTSSLSNAATGTMRSDDWNQMGQVDLQSWAKGLEGKHLTATDTTGRTITGVVSGVQQLGNTLALSVGGHLVSLSQLKQVTWSPSVA